MKETAVYIGRKIKLLAGAYKGSILEGAIGSITQSTVLEDHFYIVNTSKDPNTKWVGCILPKTSMHFLIESGHAILLDLDEHCKHEMKEYEGFTARYNYCIKCDHKELQ